MNNKISKNFTISYDMESTEGHSIDAEVLGASLLGLAKAVKQADKIINGEDSDIKVEVRAHKESSFAVEFVTWFNQGGKDVLDLIGISLFGGTATLGTVFGAIKQIKNQKVTASVRRDDGKSLLILDNGVELECPTDIEKLVTDPSFRAELDTVIYSPVKDDDKAVIKFIDDAGNATQTISAEDAVAFKKVPSTQLEEIEVSESIIDVAFVQVNFESKRGWKCRIGADQEETPIVMKDDAFLDRINARRENFVKGDVFQVRLERTMKTKIGKSPSISYAIVEVIRHRADASRKIL
ncbi:MAG: hypothetical protein JG763_3302 [Shewanella sp.]|uniref:hypothetical protein n=1 Tax=Shewanella sp. TaxID=50422 RepID=UPI001EBA18C4|nr:hypothetical protein [Shewanella sp.]MBZ4680672.1 hypothetical protein [Shewanella sp.]